MLVKCNCNIIYDIDDATLRWSFVAFRDRINQCGHAATSSSSPRCFSTTAAECEL